MPFYLHSVDANPITGEVFTDRASAFQAKTNGFAVTFIASDVEKDSWRERERRRLRIGEYLLTPWHDASFNVDIDANLSHYAHISVDKPGLIAYTPSDEYGVSDRQIRVKPGKYLSEFASHLTQAEIEDYCEAVKAQHTRYSVATTADDIRAVYLNGPDSCMSHRTSSYQTGGIHPTDVYADSDLAIAYMGSVDDPTARCVIWPAEKTYVRVYGDYTLETLLRNDGYSVGDTDGAVIRAIELDYGRYVMPYMDGSDRADLTRRNGRYVFVLGRGDYDVRNTDGTTGEREQNCSHCGDSMPYDEDESYCDSCRESEYYCDSCECYYFEDDRSRHDVNDRTLCHSCYRDETKTCAIDGCDEEWIEDEEFTEDETADRKCRHMADCCRDCSNLYRVCDSCSNCYGIDDPACDACGKTTRCESTLDLELTGVAV